MATSPRQRLLSVTLALSSLTPFGADSAADGSRRLDDSASLQSAGEMEESFATLRRIDDHPLYEMTYVGDYDVLFNIATPEVASSFGCSLFTAAGDPERPLFARNFDWDPDAALVLHTDPPDGYASVSIVDTFFLGVEPTQDPTVDAESRELLLNAPLGPIDGVNEMGLAIGLAADYSGSLDPDPAKPTVSGLRIMRLVLDAARTVDEAIDVFDEFNLDFTGGPPLHYLIADASGASAVVEFDDGEMVVIPGAPPWQVLTNFHQFGANDSEFQSDGRYATAAAALEPAGGAVDWRAALGVLEDVAQGHTQWSVTYDLRSGEMHVVMSQRWETVHELRL